MAACSVGPHLLTSERQSASLSQSIPLISLIIEQPPSPAHGDMWHVGWPAGSDSGQRSAFVCIFYRIAKLDLLYSAAGLTSPSPWCVPPWCSDPLPYRSKPPERDAYKGHQFSTAVPKTGKMPKDYFDPKFKPLFEVWKGG